MSKFYSRSQVADRTSVNPETVRYYEKCGLVPSPARSGGGHRLYTEDHARKLGFIKRCRDLGFSIAEVKGLLELASAEPGGCEPVKQATKQHLGDIQGKIKDLKKVEKALKQLVHHCESNTLQSCPAIEILFE